MDYEAMGRCIRSYRKQKRMTQADLAELIGISTSFMGHIERGSRIASLETLVKLSATLGVSLDALVMGVRSETFVAPGGNQKTRMLNDVLRVLSEHSNEWLHDE